MQMPEYTVDISMESSKQSIHCASVYRQMPVVTRESDDRQSLSLAWKVLPNDCHWHIAFVQRMGNLWKSCANTSARCATPFPMRYPTQEPKSVRSTHVSTDIQLNKIPHYWASHYRKIPTSYSVRHSTRSRTSGSFFRQFRAGSRCPPTRGFRKFSGLPWRR